jgi:hypothetical protein
MKRPTQKRASVQRPADPPVVQPTANDARGEISLTLAGITYRLRPSYTAVKAFESRTGHSLIDLLRGVNVGNLALEHLGIVAAELIRAGAEDELTRNVDSDRIAELIFEEGVALANARLALCLHSAATGGRTASGEAKAVEATE